MQVLGIITGLMAGLVWEIIANNPYKEFSTLFPSRYIKYSGNLIHIHHWIWYIFMLIIVIGWSYKTGRLLHPAVLFVIFFLGAALIYGFSKYPGWAIFFK